jgi:hypothetical protein
MVACSEATANDVREFRRDANVCGATAGDARAILHPQSSRSLDDDGNRSFDCGLAFRPCHTRRAASAASLPVRKPISASGNVARKMRNVGKARITFPKWVLSVKRFCARSLRSFARRRSFNLTRAKTGRLSKIRRCLEMRRKAVVEIRSEDHEFEIGLRSLSISLVTPKRCPRFQ